MSHQNKTRAWRRFDLVRRAGHVKRCHTFDVVKEQSIGEHTFGVINILVFICSDPVHGWREDVNPDILIAALYHDAPEVITGDTPAPAKWAYPTLEEQLRIIESNISDSYGLRVPLTDFEQRLLKFADIMDLAHYTIREARLGNYPALAVADNCIEALGKRDLSYVTRLAGDMVYNTCLDIDELKKRYSTDGT